MPGVLAAISLRDYKRVIAAILLTVCRQTPGYWLASTMDPPPITSGNAGLYCQKFQNRGGHPQLDLASWIN
jgi:hypothetical protein